MLAATDVADLLGAAGCRSARPTAWSRTSCAWPSTAGAPCPSSPPRSLQSTRRRSTRILRRALQRRLAGVQGLRGRHRLRARARAARAGARGAGRRIAGMEPSFYSRPVVEVARDLIGCTVTHAGHRRDRRDRGLPRHRARLPRLRRADAPHRVLFGPPGRSYVYFSYGMHALLNAVCEPEGVGAAVLIRALEPIDGLELMRERRGVEAPGQLCSGPASSRRRWASGCATTTRTWRAARCASGPREGDWRAVEIVADTRIGISKAVELPWRFCAAGSRFVSRPHPRRRPRLGPGRRRGAAAVLGRRLLRRGLRRRVGGRVVLRLMAGASGCGVFLSLVCGFVCCFWAGRSRRRATRWGRARPVSSRCRWGPCSRSCAPPRPPARPRASRRSEDRVHEVVEDLRRKVPPATGLPRYSVSMGFRRSG